MGDGTVLGRGTTETSRFGGALYVKSGAELNIYGGTYTYEVTSATTGQSVSHGGVIYTMGTVNMYDGTITGGCVTTAGGNVFVRYDGQWNMSGGSISTGSGGSSAGKAVYLRGVFKLSGDATVSEIFLNPDANSKTPALGDMLIIEGAYTGTAKLRVTSPCDGMDVGNSVDANLAKAKLSVYNSGLYVVVVDNDILFSLTKPMVERNAYCEYCKENVRWIGLTESDTAAAYISSGHYFLAFADDSCEFGTKSIVGYDQVCLDLNGKHLEATDRSFHIHTGMLNIMDSVGGGLVTGRGTTSQTYGGNIFVRENGTLNIFGGKFSYEDVPEDNKEVVLRGGILYIRGTVNMYGGEIFGGAAKLGGNVYVDIVQDETTGLYRYGSLNMYGGTVGTAGVRADGGAISGPCVFSKSLVTLSGDAVANELYFSVDSNGPAQGEMLTIQGVYSGTTSLSIAKYNDGMDVGTAVGADFSGAKISVVNDEKARLLAYGDDLLSIGNTPVLITSDTAVAGTYTDLTKAIAAYESTQGRIVLFADSDADVALTKDLYIDLNGYNLTGKITGEKTLYCMDTQTDDYSVNDGNYSRLSVVEGVNIAGVPVELEGAEDGYVMIREGDSLSFHRLTLQVRSMTLRPSSVGLYFTADFNGDEMVRQRVKKFGIALRLDEEPELQKGNSGSVLVNISDGVFGDPEGSNSVLIKNFMKADLTDDENLMRAGWPVYAKAFVEFEDGYICGEARNRTLQEQLAATDAEFEDLSIGQMRGVLEMLQNFDVPMTAMELTTVISWRDFLEQRKNTDYSAYLSPDAWPVNVEQQAIQDGKLHYYFMSGEGMLISETQAQADRWGDSCLIVFPNGEKMLVDTGPVAYGPVLTQNLLKMGIAEIDYLVISHPHSDHLNGAFSKRNVLDENGFLNHIKVKQVYHRGGFDPNSANAALVQQICDELRIPCDVMEKGDVLEIGGVRIEVVWPLVGTSKMTITGGEKVNDMSIVLRFDFGEHSSLFTGDLYTTGEESVLANTDHEILDADFLKVPHHGYLTSSSEAFVKRVSPELAVSTGFLQISEKLRTRYADLGVVFLDDGTKGYIHVTAERDGTMAYETSRNDAAVDGGETTPDADN